MTTTEWTPGRIRSLRESLQCTQSEMASRLGVTLRSYQRWEAEPDATDEHRTPGGPAVLLLDMLAKGAAR